MVLITSYTYSSLGFLPAAPPRKPQRRNGHGRHGPPRHGASAQRRLLRAGAAGGERRPSAAPESGHRSQETNGPRVRPCGPPPVGIANLC